MSQEKENNSFSIYLRKCINTAAALQILRIWFVEVSSCWPYFSIAEEDDMAISLWNVTMPYNFQIVRLTDEAIAYLNASLPVLQKCLLFSWYFRVSGAAELGNAKGLIIDDLWGAWSPKGYLWHTLPLSGKPDRPAFQGNLYINKKVSASRRCSESSRMRSWP